MVPAQVPSPVSSRCQHARPKLACSLWPFAYLAQLHASSTHMHASMHACPAQLSSCVRRYCLAHAPAASFSARRWPSMASLWPSSCRQRCVRKRTDVAAAVRCRAWPLLLARLARLAQHPQRVCLPASLRGTALPRAVDPACSISARLQDPALGAAASPHHPPPISMKRKHAPVRPVLTHGCAAP